MKNSSQEIEINSTPQISSLKNLAENFLTLFKKKLMPVGF